MSEAPSTIALSYDILGRSGLVVAFSDDLRGLYVVGRSKPELRRELPIAAGAFATEIFGEPCKYRWSGERLEIA